ncbi:MAG: NRDE family protein [Geobacter sp.]|nr:NRDE family protein [Geobacter sp.]
MCLIIFALHAHPRYPLIIAANRDEYFSRPTAAAAFWEDAPDILAGRDLTGCGSWLGITRGGRIAAITNYRDPKRIRHGAPSRGRLVSDFLQVTMSAEEYLAELRRTGNAYGGYNLLFGTFEELLYFSNCGDLPAEVPAGIHGLSNHLLDTPWPKVMKGKERLTELLQDPAGPSPEALLDMLSDRGPAPEGILPDTGVGLERERILSPIFIVSPDYGTRSSTVILVDREGEVLFRERTFNGSRDALGEVGLKFRLHGVEEEF